MFVITLSPVRTNFRAGPLHQRHPDRVVHRVPLEERVHAAVGARRAGGVGAVDAPKFGVERRQRRNI